VLSVWQRTRGAGVVVGLLDSGVDPHQPDYAPNMLPGANMLSPSGDTADTDGHGTVPALGDKVEAGGMLSASGALAAMASPDTTAPTAFRPLGPPPSFRVVRRGVVRFHWTASADDELEGYRLVVDGRTTIVPPGQTSQALDVDSGRHAWSVSAYDLSGNSSTARRSLSG
jgi:hypothetical protein